MAVNIFTLNGDRVVRGKDIAVTKLFAVSLYT